MSTESLGKVSYKFDKHDNTQYCPVFIANSEAIGDRKAFLILLAKLHSFIINSA